MDIDVKQPIYQRSISLKPDKITDHISAINGLHMVHFYHLSSADSPVYGILAYYRDKTVNLINTDTHFDLLFERLSNVYAQESAASEILADTLTKNVLQKTLSPDGLYKKMLEGYTPVKTPMIAPKAFSHIYILPIVKHILNILYDASDEEFSFAPRHKHWFGRGILDARKGTQELHFPYRLLDHTPLYTEVNLSNVISEGNKLNIYISLNREGLTVSCRDLFYGYKGDISYRITDGTSELSCLFTKAGNILVNTKDTCDAVRDAAPCARILKLTDTSEDDWSALVSPWGSRVYLTSKAGSEYRVFVSSEGGMTVSRCMCFRNLIPDEKLSPVFGLYAFRLYEHDDATELHFLEQASPGSGLYAEQYAGSCYTI